MPDQNNQNPNEKIYALFEHFGNEIDNFLNSISAVETGIVNAFCNGGEKTNNKSDDSAKKTYGRKN